jgi:hypothetical protein
LSRKNVAADSSIANLLVIAGSFCSKLPKDFERNRYRLKSVSRSLSANRDSNSSTFSTNCLTASPKAPKSISLLLSIFAHQILQPQEQRFGMTRTVHLPLSLLWKQVRAQGVGLM